MIAAALVIGLVSGAGLELVVGNVQDTSSVSALQLATSTEIVTSTVTNVVVSRTATRETSSYHDVLLLLIQLNASSIISGQAISINLSEYNEFPTMVNISSSNNWVFGKFLTLSPCGGGPYPFGVTIYQGYYTPENLTSSDEPLQLFNGAMFLCYTFSIGNSYSFRSMSDEAFVSRDSFNSTIPISTSVSVKGSWVSETDGTQVMQSFPPGIYTVLAGDEWGQATFAYFEVSS